MASLCSPMRARSLASAMVSRVHGACRPHWNVRWRHMPANVTWWGLFLAHARNSAYREDDGYRGRSGRCLHATALAADDPQETLAGSLMRYAISGRPAERVFRECRWFGLLGMMSGAIIYRFQIDDRLRL